MQWTDWAAIVLCLGSGFVESRRGTLTALVDVAGIVIALKMADFLYPEFVSEVATPLTAYLMVFVAVVILVFLLSWQVQASTAKVLSPVDVVLASCMGTAVGLIFAYALFRILYVGLGRDYAPFDESILRPFVYDLTWFHNIVDRVTPGAS
ncbi:MAG: CvpA family protein [Armatimonadota bacterium]